MFVPARDLASPDTKRCREYRDSIVTIVVGPEKRTFTLSKALLTHASTYFNAALNGGFKEAEECRIEMPTEDVKTFENFQKWLYFKVINMTIKIANDVPWRELINLSIFAEAHGIPDLQNAAIDSIIDKQKALNIIDLQAICHIYDNTPDSSPLRKLFVDFVCTHANFDVGGWFNETAFGNFNKRFLFDVSIAFARRIHNLDTKIGDFGLIRNKYHVTASP